MVVQVSHNDVAVPIHCDSIRKEEFSKGPFSFSMASYAASAARYCGNLAHRLPLFRISDVLLLSLRVHHSYNYTTTSMRAYWLLLVITQNY
jgi:hypothetical protein